MGERKRRPKSLNSSIAVPEEWIRDLAQKYVQSPPVTTFDALHLLQGELVQRLWTNREMIITATAQGDHVDVLVNGEVLDTGEFKPNARVLEVALVPFIASCQVMEGRFLVDDMLAGGTLKLRLTDGKIPQLSLNQG